MTNYVNQTYAIPGAVEPTITTAALVRSIQQEERTTYYGNPVHSLLPSAAYHCARWLARREVLPLHEQVHEPPAMTPVTLAVRTYVVGLRMARRLARRHHGA